jgi:hypothetical protein
MKTNIIAIIALFICIAIQAQTATKTNPSERYSEDIQTLFHHNGPIGWWVSPDFAWTRIESKDAFLAGVSGGIIINHSFSVGLAGYGIMTSQNLRYSGINDTADVYLYGGYGGLKLEYRLSPLNLINIAFPLLIGGGGAAYSTLGPNDWYNNNYYDNNPSAYVWDSFFVIEPGVLIGINLLKFMRLDAGVSYRITSAIHLPKTDSNLLNGFNANISLKFGKF